MKKVFFLSIACMISISSTVNAYYTNSIHAESHTTRIKKADRDVSNTMYYTIRFSLMHEVKGLNSSSSAAVRFANGYRFYTEISGKDGLVRKLGSYVDAKAKYVEVSTYGNGKGGYGKATIYW